MDVLVAVDKSGAPAECGWKAANWRAISISRSSGLSQCASARPAMAASGRKAPSRVGAKPALIGRNGAVNVTCSPIAAPCDAAAASAAASPGEKLGASTMTEVALMRRRTMRSRIAPLTAGDMP